MSDNAPASMDQLKFGATAVSLEAKTGRLLAIAQNTKFTQDPSLAESDPSYNSIVFAGDSTNGGSIGFSADRPSNCSPSSIGSRRAIP